MLQQVNKFACCLLDWNSIEDGAGQQNRGPKNLCDHMVRVRLAHPSLGEDCVLPQGETRFRLRIYILLNLSPYKGGGGEDGARQYPPHAPRKIWEELFPVARCHKSV